MATDNFNRADTATNAGRGANWTAVSGFSANINTNQSSGNANGDPALAYYNAITPGTSQYAQIVLETNAGANPLETQPDGGNGPAVYVQTGADSGYLIQCNTQAAQRFQLIRRIAGANTVIATYNAVAPVDGDIVRLEVEIVGGDPVLDLLVNGSSVGSPFPFTDTDGAALTSGRVGDYGLVVNELFRWDDWEGGDLAPAAQLIPDADYLLYMHTQRW